MAKTLDFRKAKKTYLTVTLADEDNTVLMISTPTKSIMDDLIVLESSLEEIQAESENSQDVIDELYAACARIMSRNKTGKVITTEFISDLFDFEDITIFFNAYMDFVSEVTNSKN